MKTNNYYVKLIDLIEENLLDKKSLPNNALVYFRSDAVSLEVCYKLLKNHYLGKPTNFEQLYRTMSYGSRQTIKTIIDNAKAKGFISVIKNKDDLRKRDILLKKSFINDFENHMEELKSKLNSM